MTLAAGTRLGPYEIQAPLGAGGMGEVYRARDTRLERTVAIKVLPSHLSTSPEVRQRFEREAKTISQLSHPHICALHDVGREGETEYLVMELVEGETLIERLAKGPLPLEQTLRYGMEMAGALDAAHRQGIVHRDLKPGNVMITKSGVKLLDFGLAKAVAPASGPQLTSLPTQASPVTQAGTVLGTFQYMAPEQLEGKEADARSDIFAFGCVLYEMATGRKAFTGASQASLISSIMKEEPAPISAVQPMAPPALDRVVKTCLAKDAEDRWQSAHDIVAELKWIAEGSSAGVAAPVAVASRRKSRERLAWILFAAAALAAAGFALGFLRRAPESPRVVRFEVVPSDSSPYLDVGRGADMAPAVSPDGRRIVFVASDAQRKDSLWVRPLDGLDARPIPGTEEASYPFWSPDSRSIGFFADGKLKRIEATGGPVQTVCDAESGRGGSWSREGVILFAPGAGSTLHRVSASGGKPEPVLAFDASHGEDSQRWPHFLPDGRHFLYFSYLGANPESKNQNGGVRLGSLDSKETGLVVPEASNPVYAEPGYLLFVRDGNLLAQPFEAKSRKASGDAIPVAQNVSFDPAKKLAYFSASPLGVLAYARAVAFPSRLLWFDRQGRPVGTVGERDDYFFPRLSPDGRKIAVSVANARTQTTTIWIYDLERGSKSRFSSEAVTFDGPAVWSPDGGRLAFGSARGGPARLFVRPVGGGTEEALLKTTNAEIPQDWSPDGRFLAYIIPGEASEWDIWMMPMDGDGERKPFPFAPSPSTEVGPRFSPDGKWVAYVVFESDKPEVYVAAFPGPGERVQVSTAGGQGPNWRGDGKELFYLAEDKKIMAVPIRAGAKLEAGLPVPLFETAAMPGPGVQFAVAADGQRFLVVKPVQEKFVLPIAVVVNWTATIEKPK